MSEDINGDVTEKEVDFATYLKDLEARLASLEEEAKTEVAVVKTWLATHWVSIVGHVTTIVTAITGFIKLGVHFL